jgi:uncharacterized membrane protein YkvA (DUF1232 family)
MQLSMKSLYNWYRGAIRNPKYRLWIIFGTLVYLLSPIDISPDFIPVVGEIDDVLLMTLMVTEVSQLLIERFKATKTDTVASNSEAANETIEVEAVSADGAK